MAGIISSAMTDPTAQAQQNYQDIFGRAGDAEGVKYWSDKIASGTSAADVANQMKEAAKGTYQNYLTNPNAYSPEINNILSQDLQSGATPGQISGGSTQELVKNGVNSDIYHNIYGADPKPRAAQQYAGPATAATYTPTLLGNPTRFEVAPNQTVQGQLSSLMDPNSPIIQSARTRAAQEAAARGLSNSSLAITAGDEAAYAAAIPIATADAATYNNAAGYNANESNVFQQQNANASNAAGQFNAGAQNTLGGQQLAANTALTQTGMQTASAQKIAEIQSQAQSSFQGASNLAALSNNYQNAILQVGSLNIDAAAKQALQQNIFNAYQQATKALDQKLGIPDTSGLLHFDPVNPAAAVAPATVAPGLDAKGNPIGTLYDANGIPVAKAANEFGG